MSNSILRAQKILRTTEYLKSRPELLSVLKGAPPIAGDTGGFPDFWTFRKMFISFFPAGFGVWGVCNRQDLAVGFTWTDSQPISSHGSWRTAEGVY